MNGYTLWDFIGSYFSSSLANFACIVHLSSWALFQIEVDEYPAETKKDEQDEKTEV